MAFFEIDLPSPPVKQFEQTTTLGGRDYILRFLYNSRIDSWFFAMYDQDESPIAVGVRLVAAWGLLQNIVDDRKPPGGLFVYDTLGAGVDPGFNDLGARHRLVYWDGST